MIDDLSGGVLGLSSPVAVFAYMRPDHLRRTLESLVRCRGFAETPVTVFCDGPKHPGEADAVEAVREVARQILGSRADLRLAAVNMGLGRSVIAGVTELVAKHGSVVVVEDDFDLAPIFLEYMNEALDRYADHERIYQISGHMFDVPKFAGQSEAVLLPMTTTWGWGTWARAWASFDPAATGWQQLRTDPKLRKRFNLGGVYDYSAMLERQMAGKADSWGIRWYWSVFKANGMTLFPPRTLVRNTGQDGSGTHGRGTFRRFSSEWQSDAWPAKVEMSLSMAAFDDAGFHHVRNAIWRQNGGWRGCAVDVAKRLVVRGNR